MNRKELFDEAISLRNKKELAASMQLLRLGAVFSPDLLDQYGHPAFKKEYLRTILSQKQWEKAIQFAEDEIDKNTEHWHEMLFARAYQSNGQEDIAKGWWGKVLAYEPNNSEALAALAKINPVIKGDSIHTRASIISCLYNGVDPFVNFNEKQYKLDLQGWNSVDSFFEQLIGIIEPKLVIEVGTWKGASAACIGSCLKNKGFGVLLCVDTWLGNSTHWIHKDKADYFDSLDIKNGRPDLYLHFLANIKQLDLHHIVVPFPQTSFHAAKVLGHFNIKADLIYIDAGHEFEDVYQDLVSYWDILADAGILCGDDYHHTWPGVIKAAHTFCKNKKLQLYEKYNKFIITKSSRDLSNVFNKVDLTSA